PPAVRVDELMLGGRRPRGGLWQPWQAADGTSWITKHLRFYPVGANGLPGEPMHLIVAHDLGGTNEMKFLVSNAPVETPVAALMQVASSGWRALHTFEGRKAEIGLDQYEGRPYQGLRRHLILSCLSYLVLSRARERPPTVEGPIQLPATQPP